MKQNIGIIGYGKFGHALAGRAEETGYNVLASEDKKDISTIAREAEILTLCVKPNRISEVSEEIRGRISTTDIVSFMAAAPAERIQELLEKKAQRAMTNLGFDSVMHTNGNARINEFCKNLSREKSIGVDEEQKVDLFTVAVGCLPGVAAWVYKNHADAADIWLSNWVNFFRAELGVDRNVFTKIINDVKASNDYESIVKKVATPGGVTESMISTLEENAEIDFKTLLGVAMERTHNIAKKV